jgi:hypothetical protein
MCHPYLRTERQCRADRRLPPLRLRRADAGPPPLLAMSFLPMVEAPPLPPLPQHAESAPTFFPISPLLRRAEPLRARAFKFFCYSPCFAPMP